MADAAGSVRHESLLATPQLACPIGRNDSPSHVIDAWLGHSTKVAERHYLLVTDDHWQRAVDSRSPTGSPIAN